MNNWFSLIIRCLTLHLNVMPMALSVLMVLMVLMVQGCSPAPKPEPAPKNAALGESNALPPGQENSFTDAQKNLLASFVSIYRCVSPSVGGKEYSNRIYVTDQSECATANYTVEGGGPYFMASGATDKQLFRWYRQTGAGILHYYLQPGEAPNDPQYVLEGSVWNIGSQNLNLPKSAQLFRCVHHCANADQNICDGNMQWLSLDQGCEGKGTGSGAILGFVLTP